MRKYRRSSRRLSAEDRLLAPPEDALDGDEDDAREDQIEHEPVQAQVEIGVEVEAILGCRAAEDAGDEDAGQRREAEHAVGAQDEADDAQHEAGQQHDEQDGADERDVVDVACLAHRQERRIAQTEDGPQAEDGAPEGEHAADPPGAEAAQVGRGFEVLRSAVMRWAPVVFAVFRVEDHTRVNMSSPPGTWLI